MPINFQNPGSAAVDELTKLLAERDAQRQRDFLNSIAQRRQALEEQQEKRVAEFQQQQFKDQAFDRESRQADRIYEDLMPSDQLTPENAGVLRRHGRGGGLRDSGPTGQVAEDRLLSLGPGLPMELAPGVQGPHEAPKGPALDIESAPVRPSIAPGIIFSERGGTKWASARQAEQARLDAQEAAAQARADEAARERASREALAREGIMSREAIAREGNLTRAQTAAAGVAARKEAADAKAAEKKEQDTKSSDIKRRAAIRGAEDITNVIDEMLDLSDPKNPRLHPGMANVVGARTPFASSIPGSTAANKASTLDRLKGNLVVDLMREMKEQSRTGATGFGALSEKELALLVAAVGQLNPNMGEARFAQELARIRNRIQLIHQDNATPSGGLPPGVTVNRR